MAVVRDCAPRCTVDRPWQRGTRGRGGGKGEQTGLSGTHSISKGNRRLQWRTACHSAALSGPWEGAGQVEGLQ